MTRYPWDALAPRDSAEHKGGKAGIAAQYPKAALDIRNLTRAQLETQYRRKCEENARLRHWIEMAAHDCYRLIKTLERRRGIK